MNLSYLHRSPGTSTPDDSSSVESEIDEVIDSGINQNMEIHDITAGKGVIRNKMKKNGVVRDIEPRMKKVSVEMKKMRKERWSLDSSGDECGRSIFLQLCKLLNFLPQGCCWICRSLSQRERCQEQAGCVQVGLCLDVTYP